MNCIVHGVTKSQTRLSNFHFITLMTPSITETLSLCFLSLKARNSAFLSSSLGLNAMLST